MKAQIKLTLLLIPILVSSMSLSHSFADADHDERESEHTSHHDHAPESEPTAGGSVGAGKAVTELSPEKGLRLSQKAAETLGLRYFSITSQQIHHLPLQSIVYHQTEVGIYRVRDRWIKLLDVVLQKKSNSEAVVKSSELKPGDQVVAAGVSLLRITELDLSAGGGDRD